MSLPISLKSLQQRFGILSTEIPLLFNFWISRVWGVNGERVSILRLLSFLFSIESVSVLVFHFQFRGWRGFLRVILFFLCVQMVSILGLVPWRHFES